jgi:hypothetical protein
MGSGGIAPSFLTSVLHERVWPALRTGGLTPKERDQATHWIEGWVGARANLDTAEERKISYSAGNRIPAVQK